MRPEEAVKVGERVRDLLSLPTNENGRFDTDGGDKTLEGLGRTILRCVDENYPTVGCWNVEDVYHQAEQNEIVLTEEQAYSILESVRHSFDASLGISWEDIEHHINREVNDEA